VPDPPAWNSGVDKLSVQRTAVIGAAWSGLNPKNLGLTAAAAASVAQSGASGGLSSLA
jgi:hypothetical protein